MGNKAQTEDQQLEIWMIGDSCFRIFEGVALSFVIIIPIYLPVNNFT